MAWSIDFSGTRAAVTTAINSIDAGPGVGAASQLSDSKTIMLARLAANTLATQFHVRANGFRDNVSDRVSILVEPVTITVPGDVIDGWQITPGGQG